MDFTGPIAYAAVKLDKPVGDNNYGLGVAVEGEAGYHPCGGVYFETEAAAFEAADKLNGGLGLTQRRVTEIIASTMRGR